MRQRQWPQEARSGPRSRVPHLVLVRLEEPQEGLREDEAGRRDGVRGDVGRLEERRTCQVHRLHHLEVDVHVERHLPPPLELLLLRRLLLVPVPPPGSDHGVTGPVAADHTGESHRSRGQALVCPPHTSARAQVHGPLAI